MQWVFLIRLDESKTMSKRHDPKHKQKAKQSAYIQMNTTKSKERMATHWNKCMASLVKDTLSITGVPKYYVVRKTGVCEHNKICRCREVLYSPWHPSLYVVVIWETVSCWLWHWPDNIAYPTKSPRANWSRVWKIGQHYITLHTYK